MVTLEERTRFGKSRRDVVSRVAQADLRPGQRSFDPLEVLRAAEHGRIPRLLPLKYARMKVSPFAFFRGSVSIMAADLARLPHSGLPVQLCGDAHVQNLGSFATPDGGLVFDINDFDETIRGPWEWDVKRMAASIVLAGRESGHGRGGGRAAAEVFVTSYARSVARFSREPILVVARHQIRRVERTRPIHAALRQSQRSSSLELFRKLTESGREGKPRFRHAPPEFWRATGATTKVVLASLKEYRRSLAPERLHLFDLFRAIDVGFKVVGTGSVGLRNYVVALEGNGKKDPLFLQIKQEEPSAYAQYLPKQIYRHQGRRAAEGQRAIQPISDLLVGWTTVGPHDYLVRQLNDHKGSIDLSTLQGAGLNSLAVVAGELLARGHARSGDAAEIHGYCGSGKKITAALRDFACSYADQAEHDYDVFLKAIKLGKFRVSEATSFAASSSR